MNCRVCSSSDYDTYVVKELHYKIGDPFRYMHCKKCGCLQIETFPEDMSRYYPKNYYSLINPQNADTFLSKIKRLPYFYSIFRRNYRDKIAHRIFGPTRFDIFNFLKIRKSTRILDVGCGNGYKYLYPLRELGFVNVLGCDPFLDAPIVYSNGLEILKTDILGINGNWDLIMYHHSFEHVSNPHENLSKVAQLLSPNGVCLIRIPTVSSYAWSHYKEYWYQLDAPRHFFLHSIDSIKYLANKHGLELERVVYDSNHKQFTNSEKYLKGESMIEPKKHGLLEFIDRKIKRWNYQNQAKDLNKKGRGDQAAFFLRKKI